MTGPRVTLYERDGCHLCAEALAGLERLRRRRPFVLERVDIARDRALEDRYCFTIPVIAVDGRVVTSAPVDLDAVARTLAAAGR